MSFSDDPTSPSAPFSGDSRIFEASDMVAASPTTDERMVNTQSGFVVVVRKLGRQLALSVKRHIGTPPTSSIALTPDESLQLSKILLTSLSVPEEASNGGTETPTSVRQKARRSPLLEGRRLPAFVAEPMSTPAPVWQRLLNKHALALSTVVLLGAGGLFGFSAAGLIPANQPSPQAQVPQPEPVVDSLADEAVDKFVRNYVADLLDFNPRTYKSSQIHAMARMAPDLLERYWKETRFPLSEAQLSRLPQGMTIMITDLRQRRLSNLSAEVEIRAQINDANGSKPATPVNLKLRVESDGDGALEVTQQQDLASDTRAAR